MIKVSRAPRRQQDSRAATFKAHRAEHLMAEFTSPCDHEHPQPDESKFSGLSKSSGALTRAVLVWKAA